MGILPCVCEPLRMLLRGKAALPVKWLVVAILKANCVQAMSRLLLLQGCHWCLGHRSAVLITSNDYWLQLP